MNDASLLFVCTGNICRSPMAEYLLRARLGARDPWQVGSAGTVAVDGIPASDHAVSVMAKRGIDLTPHRSRRLTCERAGRYGLIIAMALSHRDQIHAVMPGTVGKVFLLREFDPGADTLDVADPIGGTLRSYEAIARTITASLPGLIDFLRESPLHT